MAGIFSPYPVHAFTDDDGAPAVGHLLFTYEPGTTTPLVTYTDVALAVPNSTPIVLDSAGRCTIYVENGQAVKFVLAPPNDTDPPTSPLWTRDPVSAGSTVDANIDVTGEAGETLVAQQIAYLSDGSRSLTAGDWYLTTSDHNDASVDAPKRGVVIVGGSVGDTVTIRLEGRATVPGTLSKGAVYYLGSTAGTLDSSAVQQNRCPFGQADSTTTILFPVQQTTDVSIQAALVEYAYSGAGGGEGNAAGGGDTELTLYPVKVPDNFLNSPGDCIVVEGTLSLAANTNSKVMKVSIGSTGKLTVFTNAANVAGHIVPFRFSLIRRSATKAALTGVFYYGAGNQAATTVWLANHQLSGTVDWTVAQTLKLYLVGTLQDDILLTDLFVSQNRSPYGTLV